jgi:triosephosphate isomerase
MSRTPFFVANWKMNLSPSEAAAFARQFIKLLAPHASEIGDRFEVAIAPAYPALDRLGRALSGSGISLAAQNVHGEGSGAFTGEVSASMLADLGCAHVLLGHSERRQLFGESDEVIRTKLQNLEGGSLTPILCIGETLDEREAEKTLEVVAHQLESALDGMGDGLASQLVVAYEPIWAIGTGRTATPEIAQTVHAAIRKTLLSRPGPTGDETRILYGGSVKPSNARELLSQPDVDGALVGGASLDPESFAQITLACLETP